MWVASYLGFLCLQEWGLLGTAARKPGPLVESFTFTYLRVGACLSSTIC